MTVRIATVAQGFGRDLDECLAAAGRLIEQARADSVQLLVLPEAALGGYLADLSGGAGTDLPPSLDPEGPEVTRLSAMAGEMVVCAGYCELDSDVRYNSAVCVNGDGILGRYRKVHQPLGENASYAPGDRIAAFDTPVGRMGMLICYDKAFPEAARALALDRAEVVACLSAWAASATDQAPDLADDRWTQRFDLFDRVRALENQVVWAASNQAGTAGSMRFVASAKIVDAAGAVLATTGTQAGVATADVDVTGSLAQARRSMFHLRDRRPDVYAAKQPAATA